MNEENELIPLIEEEIPEESDSLEAEVIETEPKKDDGLIGIFIYQLIVALSFVTILLIANLFYPNTFKTAKDILSDYSKNDFSFGDAAIETVGKAITYLNELEPIDISEDEIKKINSEKPVGGEAFKESDVPSFATLENANISGDYLFPLESYEKSSDFGFRENPFTGENEFHIGLDLGAKKGEKIRAVTDGIVIKSEFDETLGKHIIIEHENGFHTIYGHCDALNVKEGISVKKGEVIATVGSSGESTGSHLHFAAKKDGKYFNPQYLFGEINDAL